MSHIINIPDKGTSLIEASAGTGKTYTLADIYIRLLTEKKLTVDKILVVTFTKAAVKELRIRIRKKLSMSEDVNPDNKILLENALRDFDKSAIFTIHGFCQRVLKENAFESGSLYNTILKTDTDDYNKIIVNDFWRKNFYNLPETIIMYLKYNYQDRLQKLFKSAETGYDILRAGTKTEDDLFIDEVLIKNTHNRLIDSFQILKENWNRSDIKKSIVEIISDKRLNQTSYKRYSDYINMMNLFLRALQPDFNLFKQFDRFTRTKLSASINNKKNPEFKPENIFFDMCDNYKKIYDELESYCSNYLTGIEFRFPEFIKNESEKIKEKNNIIFFNDLINRTHEALKNESGIRFAEKIRNDFKAALIDEFQDTDKRQYEIFKTVFGDKSILFMIGDPKQSIYGFRGADIFTYIKAVKNAAHTETLQTNWRSDSDLVESVNSIFGRIKNPFLFKEIPFKPVNASDKISSYYINDTSSSLNLFFMTDINSKETSMNITTARESADMIIADEIAKILNLSEKGEAYKIDKNTKEKNKITANDIAVLVKKNKNGITIQNMLRERGIPSVIYATESVFKSIEAEELLRIMKAVSAPSDVTALKSALATSILGYNAERITDVMVDEEGHGCLTEKFKHWKSIWEHNGFISMMKKLMLDEKINSSIIKFAGGERSITNIGHLAELIHEAEEKNNKNIDGSIRWLQDKILNNNISDLNENQLRLESDENAVTIISIHKSKGLEYGFVFCPDLWDAGVENTFIKYHENFNIVLDISPEENAENISKFESLAEDLRVIYVALTRAKYRTYLTWGKIRKSYNSAAAYLFHSPENYNPDDNKEIPDIITKETEPINMISELKNINGINLCVKDINKDISNTPYLKSSLKKDKEDKKILRDINFTINSSFKIFSYSSLIQKKFNEDRDHDAFLPDQTNINKTVFSNSENTQFPKGAVTGNFFHEIFEDSDYTDNESIKKISLEKITKYRMNEEWLQPAEDTVKKILDIEIKSDKESFRLNQIGLSSRLNELEFIFPIKKFEQNEFIKIINHFENSIKTETIPGIVQSEGYIKGFIDLVAEYNGRYYIFDWKTNYLGDSAEDYNKDSIKTAMVEGNYFLQAVIYSLAIHRYLKSRIRDYSYSKHFGGAYYVFTRGSSGGSNSSFYHFTPEEDFILKIDSYINGGN